MRLFERAATVPASAGLQGPGRRRWGPGGGYGWGGGPRWFVGGSRGPDTRTEVGQGGDFVDGGDGSAQPTDLGFPHASRWAGYPNSWEPPFYDTGGGFSGGYGYPGGGFMGGSMLAGRVSTVFACTDLVSRTLSTMELKTTQGGVNDVPPPEWTVNPEPALYSSIVEPMQAIVNCMLHRGESLIAPTARDPDTGAVVRWVVLNPDYVEIEAGLAGLPLYSIGGISVDRSQLLHMRYQTWPGCVRGVGPLEACWRNLVSADAMQAWGTALSTQNGIPAAVLQSDAKLTKDQANDIKRSWADAALARGVIPVVLSGGLTYTPLNLKPADVGLLDLRMFDEQRIASCFGVPLWLVGLPVNAGLTYSTVEGTFDYFWRATLRPLAYNIACALSWWALPRDVTLRFSSEQLTEPPIAERANMYATMIASGMLTVDEARAAEHLPPVGAPDLEMMATIRNQGV